ncbi:MAG: DMT family protein [Pseudoxanthomonas sp.]
MTARLLPLLLLLGSNIFMTFAWYGHLKYKTSPLLVAIVASWGIAFFEYTLMVPANRLGSTVYSVVQLKTIQEILTLLVFAGFSTWYLGQPLKWNHYAAFGLIVGAACLMFYEPAASLTA